MIGSSTALRSACTFTGTDGGMCIEAGNVNFTEEKVNQWTFELDYQAYIKILDAYRNDSIATGNYVDFKIAGLGFIPIITPDASSTQSQIKYITTGLRVVLVLWKGQVINGQNAPSEVVLFGYDDLAKAFTFQENPAPPSDYSFVRDLTSSASPLVQLVNDPLVHATREFEIVFLSIDDFEYLATSPNFYPGLIRPPNPTNASIPHQGITIERAFSTIEPNEGSSGMTHFRTLLFKPLPDPSSSAVSPPYPSEAAVAYRNGEYCPPYWINQTLGLVPCAQNPGDCFLKSMIIKQTPTKTDTIRIEVGGGGEEEEPETVKEVVRWDWMAMIIIAILALFFGSRAVLRSQQ